MQALASQNGTAPWPLTEIAAREIVLSPMLSASSSSIPGRRREDEVRNADRAAAGTSAARACAWRAGGHGQEYHV